MNTNNNLKICGKRLENKKKEIVGGKYGY